MSWEAITAADIARRLAAAELLALKSAAKASDQDGDTILAEAIADVTRRVRGYVAAYRTNILGPEGTLPDELAATTLALLRDYLFTRLPGMKALNDELRQKETERAERELREVAAGRFLIVGPDVPAPKQAGGIATISQANPRQVTRKKMSGL